MSSPTIPESCPSCLKYDEHKDNPGKPELKAKTKVGHWWDCPTCKTTGVARSNVPLKKGVLNLNSIYEELTLFKASLNTKKIDKVDTDKLEEKSNHRIKNANHMNGKNTEMYSYDKNKKKVDKKVESMSKGAPKTENDVERIKRKYANINEKTPDPMKTNISIAIKDTKKKNKQIFKEEDDHDDEAEDRELINDIVDDKMRGHESRMHRKKKMKKEEPDMADPEHPKGLKNKRKPVTHDECGRPFAKDEMDKPDKETENYLEHFDPKTKHPLEPTAGMPEGKKQGQRKTPTGFKLKLVKALSDAGHRESALLLKNWDEMDGVAEEFVKSNYGPKGMGQYTPVDNINRKKTRTGEEIEGVGRNKAVRRYTTMGASMQRAHDTAQQKAQEKKQKDSVKIYTDEEKKALQAEYEKKYGVKKKEKDDV